MSLYKPYLMSGIVAAVMVGLGFYFFVLVDRSDEPEENRMEFTIGAVEQADSLPGRTVVTTDCGLGGAVIVRDIESNPIVGASVKLHVTYPGAGADAYTRIIDSNTDSDGVSQVGGLGSCGGSISSLLTVSSDGFNSKEIPTGVSWGLPKVVVLQGTGSHNNSLKRTP